MITQSISPIRLLQDSLTSVGRVYIPLLILSLPSLILTILSSLVQPELLIILIILIYVLFILPWFTGALIFYLYHQLRQRSVTIGQSLQQASTKIVQLVLGLVLVLIILIPAFILLIIPGIYLSTRLAFTLYIITIENCSATEGISRSWNLVKGRWWSVFLALLVVILMIIIPTARINALLGVILGSANSPVVTSLVRGILELLIAPVLSIYYMLLYMRLQASKTASLP